MSTGKYEITMTDR